MAIGPIPAIPVPTPGATPSITPGTSAGAAGSAGNSGSGDLFSSVSDALQTVSDAHGKVDDLSVQAATGDLSAVHELTMATAEAQLLTQLTVEVRNRAVEAFNDIMRMQV